jgi:hypothetical protein
MSLRPWGTASLIVTVFITILSPFLLLPTWVCCGRTDRTADLLMAPAQPLICLVSTLELNPWMILPAIGASYGLLVLAFGAVITGLRRGLRH